MIYIRLCSTYTYRVLTAFAMLQVTQKRSGKKKNFNLLNAMFRYVETRYVFRVPLHAKQIMRMYMKKLTDFSTLERSQTLVQD